MKLDFVLYIQREKVTFQRQRVTSVYPQITSAMSGGKSFKGNQPAEPYVDFKVIVTSAQEKHSTMLNFVGNSSLTSVQCACFLALVL